MFEGALGKDLHQQAAGVLVECFLESQALPQSNDLVPYDELNDQQKQSPFYLIIPMNFAAPLHQLV